MNSRSTLVVTASILATTFVVGCAASEPTADDESVGVVEQKWSPPLTGGVCPDPALGSTERPEWYQVKATSVMHYLVGGEVPFTKKELDGNPSCVDAFKATTMLRDMLQDTKGSKATLQAAYSDTVCGLRAALYAVDFSQELNADQWEAMKRTGEYLDGCFGIGVSGFYYADPGSPTQEKRKVRRIYIDPEPARLTNDLVGSTGATAASVYVSSGIEVKTLKWPGSYVNSASPPPVGTPCSTSDLANGNETLKLLQGAGTWRRCY